MIKILTLYQAQRLILAHTTSTVAEIVPLDQALGRVPTVAIRARLAVPAFAQSCRDGFALRAKDTGSEPVNLQILGEIPAGWTRPTKKLQPGQAYRIMTGGMLPPGADSVIAFEEAGREEAEMVVLSGPYPRGAHIRAVGADLRRNQVIVRSGTEISPEHLPRLATAGVDELPVYARPRVGLLCTGNELLEDPAENPEPGNLIGGNRFLLAGLIRRYGGEPVNLGIVKDDASAIAAALVARMSGATHRSSCCSNGGLDLIISTGGMGPGKYDLVARALASLKSETLYHQLRLRPGKATLAALLGDCRQTLFFGLPGPPPVVCLLFYLLIAPALRRAQGYRQPRPVMVKAHLSQPLKLRCQGGIVQLKGAILETARGRLLVRRIGPGEVHNAIILAPAKRRELKKDELVTVQPISTGFC